MEPWIGSKYLSSPFNGTRLLILGESEYEWKPGCLTSNVATELISQVAEGMWTNKFYSNIFRVLTGIRRTQAAAGVYRDFWHSVSFYNFVQEAVGPAPRYRPSEAMWQNGLPYFETVLAELSPRVILVLGKQLWWNLVQLAVVNDAANGNQLISVGSSVALATYICHPSSSRYSYAVWRPSVEKLLFDGNAQARSARESFKDIAD